MSLRTITVDGDKIPSELFLKVPDNKQIETAARFEAEMTFLKFQAAPEKESSRCVHLYPEFVKTREEMFLFAMKLGENLHLLRTGARAVSPQTQKEFKQRMKKK